MKNKRLTALLLSAGLALQASSAIAAPPSTAFTYQGSLSDAGGPANGPTPMNFKLWDAVAAGNQVGSTVSSTVDVIDGVFSESLDFGADSYAVNQALWLEIIVDGQSMGRTPMSATPFALNTRGIGVAEDGGVLIRSDGDSYFTTIIERSTAASGGNLYLKNTVGTSVGITMNDVDDHLWGIASNHNGNGLGGGQFYIYDSASTTDGTVFSIQRGTGNVGIGTTTPRAKLEVDGRLRVIRDDSASPPSSGIGMEIFWSGSRGVISPWDRDTDTSRDLSLVPYGGRVMVGDGTPATALDVNGAVTIRGGADIVEGFDSICGTAFDPGTVLVIDPENPGKLMCSEDAYDYKVAGVVSGANGVKPGIKLGQAGVMDGEIPVAMTGRVYVKCSAENGPIMPGDRLTTSSIRGHAMKATDGELSDGAVIGKAMSSLDESTGMVLVLVNLQ